MQYLVRLTQGLDQNRTQDARNRKKIHGNMNAVDRYGSDCPYVTDSSNDRLISEPVLSTFYRMLERFFRSFGVRATIL